MVYTDNFRRLNYDSRKIACYYGIAPFGKDSALVCILIRMYIIWRTDR